MPRSRLGSDRAISGGTCKILNSEAAGRDERATGHFCADSFELFERRGCSQASTQTVSPKPLACSRIRSSTIPANGNQPRPPSRTLVTTIWYPAQETATASTPTQGASPDRRGGPYPAHRLCPRPRRHSAVLRGPPQSLGGGGLRGRSTALPAHQHELAGRTQPRMTLFVLAYGLLSEAAPRLVKIGMETWSSMPGGEATTFGIALRQ